MTPDETASAGDKDPHGLSSADVPRNDTQHIGGNAPGLLPCADVTCDNASSRDNSSVPDQRAWENGGSRSYKDARANLHAAAKHCSRRDMRVVSHNAVVLDDGPGIQHDIDA